jgi:hypothetical protein
MDYSHLWLQLLTSSCTSLKWVAAPSCRLSVWRPSGPITSQLQCECFLCKSANIFIYGIHPYTLVSHLLFNMPLSQLYATSVMSTLNSRSSQTNNESASTQSRVSSASASDGSLKTPYTDYGCLPTQHCYSARRYFRTRCSFYTYVLFRSHSSWSAYEIRCQLMSNFRAPASMKDGVSGIGNPRVWLLWCDTLQGHKTSRAQASAVEAIRLTFIM